MRASPWAVMGGDRTTPMPHLLGTVHEEHFVQLKQGALTVETQERYICRVGPRQQGGLDEAQEDRLG